MTEIEKAGKGKSVNLNKLAKELEKEFNALQRIMIDDARRELDGEKRNTENHALRLACAAGHVTMAVNAMINQINADARLAPVVVAGVAACGDALKGTFDGFEKRAMEVLCEEILCNSTVYIIRKGNQNDG